MSQKLLIKPEGYFEEKASLELASRGFTLPDTPTPLESKLMAQLLLISGAAEGVLSDVNDDGVVEASDMAVLGMRKALLGERLSKFLPASRAPNSQREKYANDVIQKVLQDLTRARELAEKAGYGSQVLEPLADAQKEVRHALDTALGRN